MLSPRFKRDGANLEFWDQFNHVKLESMLEQNQSPA